MGERGRKVKYKLTDETIRHLGRTLYRIEAVKDFGNFKRGDKGGFIEKESNLSHDDNAWVYGDALVYGDAKVYGDAWVYDNAWVHGNAKVYDNAEVYDNALVCGDAEVYDNAWVHGNAWVRGNAEVCDDAWVCETSHYVCFQSFGSSNRTTTVFRTKNGYLINCGCFTGDLDKFSQAVDKKHGDNRLGLEYKAIIEVIKLRVAMWAKEV